MLSQFITQEIVNVFKQESNNHVGFFEFIISEPKYRAHCTVCQAFKDWDAIFINKQGVYIVPTFIIDFCNDHKHTQLPEVKVNKIVNVNGKDWEVIESKVVKPEEQPMDILADVQIHDPTRITAVGPYLLKWLAKLSDFNVDLQCTRTRYRLLCTKCQAEKQLTKFEVYTMNREGQYPEIVDFLTEHRHDIKHQQVEGRRFR
jgi:hypothetical protein